jgi:ABC-2 type transport system permease protein
VGGHLDEPGLRQFAEYQPFTPITGTLRGVLLDTHIGTDWIQAVGWCAALTVVGYLGSRRLFDRRRTLTGHVSSAVLS